MQQSIAYDEYRARRVAAEHRLARLVQLGIRRSRYFGRVKTRFQVWLPRWPTSHWWRAKSSCPAVPVAAQKATTSSSMFPRCCRQCCGQFQRCPARTTIVPDFAHVSFTAEIPLPNQRIPPRFLGVCLRSGLFPVEAFRARVQVKFSACWWWLVQLRVRWVHGGFLLVAGVPEPVVGIACSAWVDDEDTMLDEVVDVAEGRVLTAMGYSGPP